MSTIIPAGRARFRFCKLGRLKFISHLDLLRTVKGALLRAGVPLVYTEGYHPHPKMVFALPLPLGVESVCELLDIRLTEPRGAQDLLEAVRARLTDELPFVEVYPASRPFSDITAADYRFRFRDPGLTAGRLREALTLPLPIEKKSKRGIVKVDMREGVLSFTLDEENGEVLADARLAASPDNFASPENLVRALRAATALPLDDYDICRTEILAGEEIFR